MVVHPKVTPGDTVYTVTYRSTDEAAILFQRWGSIWPKVRSVSVCCERTAVRDDDRQDRPSPH
jgi:hypothetical protein